MVFQECLNKCACPLTSKSAIQLGNGAIALALHLLWGGGVPSEGEVKGKPIGQDDI